MTGVKLARISNPKEQTVPSINARRMAGAPRRDVSYAIRHFNAGIVAKFRSVVTAELWV